MVSCRRSLCTLLLAFSVFVLSDGVPVAKKEVAASECKRHCMEALCETELGETREENENPYVFHNDDFATMFESEEGQVKVLKKFTERSDFFRGIENVRMLVFEANPRTFVIPSHWGSDILLFVTQGRGTITLVFGDRIESFNVEKGHLMTIPAGTTYYMINRDDNEQLILSGFIKPIANPGHFAPFFATGGHDPESFFHAFSTEVLQTVFNISSDRLQNLFSQQRKGVIIKASEDQIKALTAEENYHLPHGSSHCLKKYGPCQILYHCTTSTESGKIFMVLPTEYLILQDLDMYISFSVTSQGCMNSPIYSTRVTKIITVIKGRGRFEMAAPSQEEGSARIHYKKISAELQQGMVFVVPPGYPLVLMASQDEDLETLNLEFSAKGNERYFLGGPNNVLKNLQTEAKELAFAISAEEVDEVLNRQSLEFFMKGPPRLQGRNTGAF